MKCHVVTVSRGRPWCERVLDCDQLLFPIVGDSHRRRKATGNNAGQFDLMIPLILLAAGLKQMMGVAVALGIGYVVP